MDFAPCPKCGAMNAPDAVSCAECKSPLDAEPEAPAIGLKAEPEPAPAEPEPAPAPPPFEAAPEVLAKVAKLEADIAQRPQARALYAQLAQLYADGHRTDLAVAVLERGLAVDPANVTFRHRIAQLTGRTQAKVAIPGVTDAPASAPSARAGATVRVAPVFRPTYSAPRAAERDGLSRGRIAAIAGAAAAVAVAAWLVFFPSSKRIVSGDFLASAPVWSPTGKHLAFLVSDAKGSQVGVYDFKAGAHRLVGPATGWGDAAVSWSPDGLRLAYVAPGEGEDWSGAIHVYDVVAGQSKRLAAGSSPQWRAGGDILAVCGPERPAPGAGYGDEYARYDFQPRFCRIDPASGAVTRTALAADYGMALSPLLDRVVFERWSDSPAAAAVAAASGAGGEDDLQSMADNIVAGRAENVVQGARDLNREVEARKYMEKKKAAKGDAARVPSDVEVFAADVDRGEAVRLAPAGQAAFARWTASGDRILFAANGPSGIEFWTMRDDGTDRQPALQGVKVYDPGSVTLSPDGREIFFVAPVEGDPGVARLMTGEEPADLHVTAAGGGTPRRLSNTHSFKHRYAVSPDGKRIAYEVLEDVKMIGGAGRSEIWVMSR